MIVIAFHPEVLDAIVRMIRRYTYPKGEAISDRTYNTGTVSHSSTLMARHRLGPPSTTRHVDGALGHDQRVPSLPCQVVRWVRDEPNPGWVEAQFTDAHGEVWHFFDKPPIFERADGAPLTRATSYPVDIEMPVTVIETRESDLGVVAVIALPWGLDYDLAQDTFEVLPDRLRNY